MLQSYWLAEGATVGGRQLFTVKILEITGTSARMHYTAYALASYTSLFCQPECYLLCLLQQGLFGIVFLWCQTWVLHNRVYCLTTSECSSFRIAEFSDPGARCIICWSHMPLLPEGKHTHSHVFT